MARIKKRTIPEINAGSMADIAFLLLIFFIVATTMDIDSGLLTKLPPMPPPDQEEPPPIKERNIFQVLVNANNQILVEGEWGDIEKLKDQAKEFVDNNYDGTCGYCAGRRKDNLSDNPDKAVISLQNDRGTSYDMYIQVQNELKKAYNELRETAARDKFGKSYNELVGDPQREIQKMYPMKISEAEPKNVAGN
jgi:biopolymer transport protein ExbD